MRWPWRRHTLPAPPNGDAAQARREAEERLQQAERRQPHVERVARSLRAARQRNDFAAMISAALGRR